MYLLTLSSKVGDIFIIILSILHILQSNDLAELLRHPRLNLLSCTNCLSCLVAKYISCQETKVINHIQTSSELYFCQKISSILFNDKNRTSDILRIYIIQKWQKKTPSLEVYFIAFSGAAILRSTRHESIKSWRHQNKRWW